ncbi:beta strand repeat-containing protein [Anatilimnocola floriformis]|uniref:beta strand repeat-containing protein n=1 Tax=Anatilimnocola floriformis TaxID=2948575 RepID=UPI0020C3E1FC|nr:autotransporter-associated beta strand repeat-containing protein [Anatilimnocola floriformis]
MMAVLYWQGDVSNAWSNLANWTTNPAVDTAPAVAVTSGDTLNFATATVNFNTGAAQGYTPNNDIAGLNNLTINITDGGASDFTLSGAAVGLSGTLTSAVSVGTGATISMPLTVAATDFNVTANLTASGVVGGTSLSKSGAGTLILSNNNTFNGGATVNLGTLNLQTGAAGLGNINPLGSGALTVNNGANVVVSQSSATNVGLQNSLSLSWYNTGAATALITGIGNNTTTGGLLGVAAQGSKMLTSAVNFGNDAAFAAANSAPLTGAAMTATDNFMTLQRGYFTPSVTGTYQFGVGNQAGGASIDDEAAIYLDTSLNGTFDQTAGERVAYIGAVGNDAGAAVNLTAGVAYPIAIAFREGTGGSNLIANVQRTVGAPTVAWTNINPGTGSGVGTFSAYAPTTGGAFNNVVNLNGTAAIEIQVPNFAFTSLNAAAGSTLNVNGTGTGANTTLTFGSAVLAGAFNINTNTAQAAVQGVVSQTVAANFTKAGTNVLTLHGTNTYGGVTAITAGTLRVGNQNALGTIAGGTTINGTGTLDIHGFRIGPDGNEPITAEGTGVGGNGAIINTRTAANLAVIRTLSLSGNATFSSNSRWDIRDDAADPVTFDMNGFTLTKVGGAELCIVNGTILNPGSVNVNANIFRLEGTTAYNGTGTISVATGATLDVYGATPQTHSVNIALVPGANFTTSSSGSALGPGPVFTGSLTLSGNGNANMNLVRDTTFTGQVTGTGGFNKNTSAGVLTLTNNTNNYAGTTAVNAGMLVVTQPNALGATTAGTSVAINASLRYDATAGAITAAAEPLLLNGLGLNNGGALQSMGNDVTLSGPIALATDSTISSNTAARTLTLNGAVNPGVNSDLLLAGPGNFDINGDISQDYYTLSPFTARVFTGAAPDLLSPTVATNFINGTTVPTRSNAYNGPLQFANAAAFSAIYTTAITLGDNFTDTYEATLTVTTPGTYTFAGTNNDDGVQIWLKPSANAAFGAGDQLYAAVPGNSNTTVATRTLTPGTYTLLYVHRENTGGESFTGRIGSPGQFGVTDGTTLPVVNPAAPPVSSSQVVKTGAGNLNLSGNNSYTGVTLVHQGTLTVDSNNALGASTPVTSDVTIGALAQQWQVGIDNNANSEFAVEGGTINAAPGSATVKDDDWYFAGTYPAPIGVVAADEPLTNFERAITNADPTRRIHFNAAAVEGDDNYQLLIDIVASNFTGGNIPIQVQVNGVTVHAATISADGLVTTPVFTGASVGMTTGDNVVTITRTTGAGTGTHVQFDYIRLNRQGVVYGASNTQLEPGTSLTVTGGITSPESITANGAAGIFATAGANTVSGGVNMLTNTTYDVSGGASLALTGTVSGATANLTKVGAGTLTLAGTNTYGGTTGVNVGTLVLQGGNAILNTAGAVSVANAATLQLDASESISAFSGAATSTLALAGNALTVLTGNVPVGNVTTANGRINASAGAIVDNNAAAMNITGTGIVLNSTAGVGSVADPLETTLSALEAAGGTGGVFISNTGNLTLGGISALIGVSGGDDLVITTTGSISIPEVIAASGVGSDVLLTATDAAAAGQDIAVNANITAGGVITLSAGDNVTIPTGTRLAAAGTVTVNIDAGNADPGVGGSLVFDGDIDALNAVFNGAGDTNGDSFDVRPDQDAGDVLTPIQVNGLAPITGVYPVGDRLIADIIGLGIPTLTLGAARSGSFNFGALAASLTYSDIESVVTDPAALAFHLVLDMRFSGYQNGVADTINARLNPAGTDLLLDVNGGNVFTGAASGIQSLTVIGSTDNDSFTIQETAGGLPKFKSAAPAVNNSGIGGGVSAGSHLGSAADLLLETLLPAGTPWDADDATVHFDGGVGGSDSLTVNYTTTNTTGLFSDTNDAGNSGNLLTSAGTFPTLTTPTLLLSFANVEPVNLNGAGGALLADATGTAATANLTVTDSGPATTIAGDGGFAPTTFAGYQSATLVGGGGAESINVVSVDNATLTNLTVLGGNTNDLLGIAGGDASADTLRISSLPATVAALLRGNAGSDNFQLFDAGNSVDNIAGNVTIDGTDGNLGGNTDTLTIVNTGSSNADAAIIGAVAPGSSQDYFIDGVTTAVSTDVVFRNIDVLNYTGTTFNDSIDARLVNTTPTQHDLNTLNLSGWTGADQFLLYTSDQAGGTGANNTPTGVASGVNNVNLYGDAPGNPNLADGGDTFGQSPVGISGTGANNVGLATPSTTRMIRPSTSTTIAIDGGQPSGLVSPQGDVAGDVINVDISALTNATPVVVSTFSPGTVVASGIQPLTWTQIEDINLVDQGLLTNVQMGDLFARATPGADLIQMTANPTTANPNQVRLRMTTTIGNYSASNKTIIYGGAGNDTLSQSNLTIPAEFYGEAGDDYLTGAMNNDWLVGGADNDRINGSGGDNIIWGDNAPTTSDPNPQDALTGGNDTLSGLGGNDVFYGSGGNDIVSGGAGNDYASGGAGDDSLDGNDGDDRLYGGAGNDVIGGQNGNDLISGGAGNDKLYGGTGSDVIIGGDGMDTLDGSDGNDLLVGGMVAGETSSRTSAANTMTFSPANYTNGTDNDAALLTLLAQWATSNDSSALGAITHDHVADQLSGGAGNDNFCWEAVDVAPGIAPSDFGVGDQRFGPNA